MTLASIDWTNAVIIPLLFTLLLGVPIAIYTGLIASRMFAFLQARYRAAQWPWTLIELGKTAKSPHEFLMAMSDQMSVLTAELRSLGYKNASWILARVFSDYVARWALIYRVPIVGNHMPDLPVIVDTEEWNRAMRSFYDFQMERMNDDVGRIHAARPNPWAIFTLRPFPDYYNEPGGFSGLLPKE